VPIEASAWQRLRLLLNRSPDNARIKNKMMYASTKDFFKSYLEVRPAVERHGVSELCNNWLCGSHSPGLAAMLHLVAPGVGITNLMHPIWTLPSSCLNTNAVLL
jgi:Cofilin/tropomyosin-type actin-binding protein